MARSAEGWRIKWKRGIAHVRFTHNSERYEVTTGERDPVPAKRKAAQIYTDITSGRWDPKRGTGVLPGTPLESLMAKWLADAEGSVDEGTWLMYTSHVTAHLVPFFQTIDRVTDQNWEAYWKMRLRTVLRSTVLKELSTLRTFMNWAAAAERRYVMTMPTMPTPSKRFRGVRSPNAHNKATPVELSPEEVELVIDALPEWSKGSHRWTPFPVRARFIVAYETALRPATLDGLTCPEHFRKGAPSLVITDEIDKARFGRTLPLTDRARWALESVCSGAGPIFGAHEYSRFLKEAAAKVLSPAKAKLFAAYDLRHARATHLMDETSNIMGVAFMLGHKKGRSTTVYLNPSKRAAESMLAQLRGRTGARGRDHVTSPARSAPSAENANLRQLDWVRGYHAEIAALDRREARRNARRPQHSGATARRERAVQKLLIAAKHRALHDHSRTGEMAVRIALRMASYLVWGERRAEVA